MPKTGIQTDDHITSTISYDHGLVRRIAVTWSSAENIGLYWNSISVNDNEITKAMMITMVNYTNVEKKAPLQKKQNKETSKKHMEMWWIGVIWRERSDPEGKNNMKKRITIIAKIIIDKKNGTWRNWFSTHKSGLLPKLQRNTTRESRFMSFPNLSSNEMQRHTREQTGSGDGGGKWLPGLRSFVMSGTKRCAWRKRRLLVRPNQRLRDQYSREVCRISPTIVLTRSWIYIKEVSW